MRRLKWPAITTDDAPVPPATRGGVATRRWAAIFIVAYLVVQVAVPLVQVLRPGISPSGWEMYNELPPDDRYTVTYADGRRQEIDEVDYTAAYQPWIDWATHLPPHLCRVLPGAIVVETRDRGGATAEYRCS